MQNYVVGQRVSFIYNNIRRDGVVDRVNVFGITVKLDSDRHGRQYKSFMFGGIKPIEG
jgi:hypothetical protein